MKAYIGVDNGVSGSIAMILGDRVLFAPVPVRTEQSYTKAKANITRIEVPELVARFQSWLLGSMTARAFVERPYVNPQGFKATASALRALEATLICLETVNISYQYVDSKQWQRELLPKGCVGAELKRASLDIGIRLFPSLREELEDHKDADSLLIAEWARRNNL